MILVDTGPLVGLINPRDEFHVRSRADLGKIASQPMIVTVPVLTETFVFLRAAVARNKLVSLLNELNVTIQDISGPIVVAAIDWMKAYADQEPDFADAVAVILSTHIKGAVVWTYDSEFRTTWRRPDGSVIPLAIRI